MSEKMEADDEPVVAEYPVVLAQCSASLFLLQAHNRPASKPMFDSKEELPLVHFRKAQQQLEIVETLSTDTPCYSRGAAEQFAVNAGGTLAKHGSITSITHETVNSAGARTRNCSSIGFVHDGKFILCPIGSYLAVQPKLDYLQQASSRRKAAEDPADTSATQAGAAADASTGEVVRVRYQTEKHAKREKASYAYHAKTRAEEAAVELLYNPEDRSEAARRGLVSGLSVSCKMPICQEPMNDADLMQAMVRVVVETVKTEEQQTSEDQKPSTSSLNLMCNIRKLPFGSRIKAFLVNAGVLRFSQLRSILDTAPEVNDLLVHVQQYAVLVQGCWVVSSSTLYADTPYSPLTGVSAEILTRARDFLLYRFTQSPVVRQKELHDFLPLLQADVDALLQSLSCRHDRNGYHFKYARDEAFIQAFPAVVERQTSFWNVMGHKLWTLPSASGSDAHPPARQRRPSGMSTAAPPQRRRRRTGSRSQSSDSDVPNDDGSAKSKRPSRLHPLMPPPASTPLHINSPSTPTRPRSPLMHSPPPKIPKLSQGAVAPVEIVPTTPAKPVVVNGTDQNDAPTTPNACLDALFTAKPVVKLSQARQALSGAKFNINQPSEIEQLMAQCGAMKVHHAELTEPLYVTVSHHQDHNGIRRQIVEFMQHKKKFRFSTFHQACFRILPPELVPSENVIRNLLAQYCVLHGKEIYSVE